MRSVCSTMRRRPRRRPCRRCARAGAARRGCRSVSAGWSMTVRNGDSTARCSTSSKQTRPMSSRHRQAAFAQRLHGADRGHVVDGEDRGRQRVERQHLLRGAIAADLVDGGAEDEVLAIRRCRPRRAPPDSRASRSRPVEVSSASVRWAMSRWPTAIRCSTSRRAPAALSLTTRSQSRSGKARSSSTSGKAAAQQREDAVPRMVAGRREQQPLDPMRDQVLDIFALEPEVALAVAEAARGSRPCGPRSRRRAPPARRTG